MPRSRIALLLALAVLVLCRPPAGAQLTPGTTNHIVAAGETGVDYLLYVPTSYVASNPPPLLIYFDPGGYSEYGMPRLQPSCENAGWVLVCPNVLKNGDVPQEKLVEREVIDDIQRHIQYDRGRVYLSGLSGGSLRANQLSREYWNEFAGLLVFGCWIGDYDDYAVFPDKLAVARSNGDGDAGALYYEPRDLPYYTQTLVRVSDFRFTGGHEIGPPGTTDVAIAWLDQDFQSIGTNYLPSDFELDASNAVLAASAALAVSNYTAAATNAVNVLYRWPMSSSVRDAEDILVDLFSDEARRTNIFILPLPTNALEISWMLMQRGLSTDTHFPVKYPVGYFEAATVYDPTNARALAELAEELTDDPSLRWNALERTFDLSALASQLRSDVWFTWYSRASAYAGIGDMTSALAYAETAYATVTTDKHYALRPGHPRVSQCEDAVARYGEYVAQYRDLPSVEDFETYPIGFSVDQRGGWVTPWGSGLVDGSGGHAGCSALCMTGVHNIVRLNFHEVTNGDVWVDYYVQPAYAETSEDPIIPADCAMAVYVNSNGLLRVYDGSASVTGWVTLAHAPLSTQSWSRVALFQTCTAQSWSVYLNDALVAGDLGFANLTSAFTSVSFFHESSRPGYVDTLMVSTSGPPAADTDRDGMPDAWEAANMLDSNSAVDASLDPDLDLYVNFEEYRNGTSPAISNPPPASGYASIGVAGTFNRWEWTALNLSRSNQPCRHYRWEGDIVVVATNRAEFRFVANQLEGASGWGESDQVVSNAPLAGVAETGRVQEVNAIHIQGPLNALYHFMLDEQCLQYSVAQEAFNDVDGDSMLDEWELAYFGSVTGADPEDNPDHDAFTVIEEYFSNKEPDVYDYYSAHWMMAMPGTWNGWNTEANAMDLVGDYLWRGPAFRPSSGAHEFKFAADGTWDVDWGDNNQPSNTTPFRGVAEAGGSNIGIGNTAGKRVVVAFNEKTGAYAVSLDSDDGDLDGMSGDWENLHYGSTTGADAEANSDGDKYSNLDEYLHGADPHVSDGWAADQSTMTVAGNFNGWNAGLNNMQLVTNHTWRYEHTFGGQSNVEFKFAANGGWALAWGDPDQTDRLVPIIGDGDDTPGSPNLLVQEAMAGVYWFTFHDLSETYRLDYSPYYIVVRDGGVSEQAPGGIVLKWISSAGERYSICLKTNLMEDGIALTTNIPATPPLNTYTQLLDAAVRSGSYYIRLEP